MEYYAIKVHYFDASALVKLVADDADEEPGREVLRKYYHQYAHPGYTTSFCISEAFGALKLKFLRKKIAETQYLKYVKDLIRVVGNKFQIDELEILLQVVSSEFERLACNKSEAGLVSEFWLFLCQNKKWWLLPILVTILLFGALAFFATTGAAPFIYTLF